MLRQFSIAQFKIVIHNRNYKLKHRICLVYCFWPIIGTSRMCLTLQECTNSSLQNLLKFFTFLRIWKKTQNDGLAFKNVIGETVEKETCAKREYLVSPISYPCIIYK